MTVGRGTGGRPGFRRQMRAGHGGARQIVERATAPETSIPPPPRALATPALELRAARCDTVGRRNRGGTVFFGPSRKGARGGERGLAAAPIPTQARNRAKTLVLHQVARAAGQAGSAKDQLRCCSPENIQEALHRDIRDDQSTLQAADVAFRELQPPSLLCLNTERDAAAHPPTAMECTSTCTQRQQTNVKSRMRMRKTSIRFRSNGSCCIASTSPSKGCHLSCSIGFTRYRRMCRGT